MTLDLLAAIAKLVLYGASLVGAGAALAALGLRPHAGAVMGRVPTWVSAGASTTIAASLAVVILLLGRLGWDFSPATLTAVFAGRTGVAAALQLFGAIVLLAGVKAGRYCPRCCTAGGFLLLASFGVNGHSPAAGAIVGAVAFGHVSAAAWWLGGLLILHAACTELDRPALARLVRRFSSIAVWIVMALAAAGTALVIALLGMPSVHWLIPYAFILGIKLAFVASALGVAAFNRFRLAPRLAAGDPGAASMLRRSIATEVFAIAMALAATAVLTTYTSPHA